MTKRISCSLLLILFAVSGAFAQSQRNSKSPFDLSGVWALSKGSFEHPFADLAARGLKKADIPKLRITHEGDEITILPIVQDKDLAEQVIAYKYFTDGRGESNPRCTRLVSKSKTKWKDGRIITKGGDHGPNLSYQAFTKVWVLSSDGQTLTVTTEHSATTYVNGRESFSLASRPKSIEVFTRQP